MFPLGAASLCLHVSDRASWVDNGTCVLWQCAPEMLGWAEAEEAASHQENQYIHWHIRGVLHPLCPDKVSGDLEYYMCGSMGILLHVCGVCMFLVFFWNISLKAQ